MLFSVHRIAGTRELPPNGTAFDLALPPSIGNARCESTSYPDSASPGSPIRGYLRPTGSAPDYEE
jgi:hypothetical protein